MLKSEIFRELSHKMLKSEIFIHSDLSQNLQLNGKIFDSSFCDMCIVTFL